jgi:hypothetical protein
MLIRKGFEGFVIALQQWHAVIPRNHALKKSINNQKVCLGKVLRLILLHETNMYTYWWARIKQNYVAANHRPVLFKLFIADFKLFLDLHGITLNPTSSYFLLSSRRFFPGALNTRTV